jgi:hypothetical protein
MVFDWFICIFHVLPASNIIFSMLLKVDYGDYSYSVLLRPKAIYKKPLNDFTPFSTSIFARVM